MNRRETVELNGESILLRHVRASDVARLARHAHDREIARWTFIPYPYGDADARSFIARDRKLRKKGTADHLAIIDRPSGDVIGMVGIEDLLGVHRRGEIGYWLSRQHRGRGVMREALLLALDHFFRQYKLKRIIALVFPGNDASEALLRRIGFVEEGRLRKHAWHNRRWRDLIIFGILSDEFRTTKRRLMGAK